MPRLPRFRLSFQAKVLVPVVSIMVLLAVVPMLVVSRRMSSQLESGASENLQTVDAVFKNLQAIRATNLLLRYRNVPNEPRFKAVAQKSDPKTLQFLLGELLEELGGDVVVFSNNEAQHVARVSRDARFKLDQFTQQSARPIQSALAGQPGVDTIGVDRRLYDVVSIPASVGENVIGAFTVGIELGNAVAQELKQLTHSEIVLLVNNQVAVSTLPAAHLETDLRDPLNEISATASPGQPPARRARARRADTITVNDEHFMYLTGQLGEARNGPQLGYIVLSSYEKPLRILQATQQNFLWIQLAGIFSGTLFVWFLVGHVTNPLRQLRDTAEAVGRGDFTRRVEVSSRDECGELAGVFNQMTANLNTSRAELQQAVETLKATQAQLIQSEKLRAIGTLAGGIAHDFNNILGAILGFGELVLEDLPSETRNARNMRQVMKAGERAKELVRQILAFSRQSEPQRAPVRLSVMIEETLKLLRATIPVTVQIETRIHTSADTVVADSTQLHQVLMNLGTNASHAMRDRNGTLTVSLEDFTVPPSGSSAAPQLTPGQYLRLAVADTGHGMDRAVIERIFEPFFTTKPVGEGTGLGLSVVHGIIESHGGEITVSSVPGQGTTFSIFLPQATPSDGASVVSDEPVHGHRERILVVDDEEPLVNMMQQKLSRLGYEVVAHHDSLAALREFQSAPHRFDVIITDQTMPHLTGADLAREMTRLRADTPIIMCSGSGQALIKLESLRPAVRECVLKPVNFGELSRSIRRVLDDKASFAVKQP
jgi:signal transduction histidine kinase/ActR/RegA family two-component response regulator